MHVVSMFSSYSFIQSPALPTRWKWPHSSWRTPAHSAALAPSRRQQAQYRQVTHRSRI